MYRSWFSHVAVILLDVNVAVRKIATLLKPDKDIVQNGDHFIIKTLSTFRNYNMDFVVGQEFEEDLSGVDDRKCMVSELCQANVWGTCFQIKLVKNFHFYFKYFKFCFLHTLKRYFTQK